jgi:SAM-dependent methyltransferase
VCADACELPLPDASIGGAISIEALPYFASRLTALQEIHRVLRPGGRFAFADLVSTDRLLELHPAGERETCRAALEQGFGPWPELWQPVDYVSLARMADLIVVSDRDITANVLPSSRWMVFPDDGSVPRAVNASTEQLTAWMEAGAIDYRLVVLERSGSRGADP